MSSLNEKRKSKADERRRKVMQMSLKGFKTKQLAEHFGVTMRTIERDFEALKKDLARSESNVDPWALQGFLTEKQRQRAIELWRIIEDTSSSRNDKLSAIRELRQEDEFAVKRAQIVGIMPKDNITVLPPVQSGDGSNNTTQQQVNIYQTLLNIKKQEEKMGDVIEKEEKYSQGSEEQA